MKHTKGPWHTTGESYNDQPQISEERTGKTIALCYGMGEGENGTTEAGANAFVMAAGAELLNACKCALADLEGCKQTYRIEGNHALEETLRELQDAINKAEGE